MHSTDWVSRRNAREERGVRNPPEKGGLRRPEPFSTFTRNPLHAQVWLPRDRKRGNRGRTITSFTGDDGCIFGIASEYLRMASSMSSWWEWQEIIYIIFNLRVQGVDVQSGRINILSFENNITYNVKSNCLFVLYYLSSSNIWYVADERKKSLLDVKSGYTTVSFYSYAVPLLKFFFLFVRAPLCAYFRWLLRKVN